MPLTGLSNEFTSYEDMSFDNLAELFDNSMKEVNEQLNELRELRRLSRLIRKLERSKRAIE